MTRHCNNRRRRPSHIENTAQLPEVGTDPAVIHCHAPPSPPVCRMMSGSAPYTRPLEGPTQSFRLGSSELTQADVPTRMQDALGTKPPCFFQHRRRAFSRKVPRSPRTRFFTNNQRDSRRICQAAPPDVYARSHVGNTLALPGRRVWRKIQFGHHEQGCVRFGGGRGSRVASPSSHSGREGRGSKHVYKQQEGRASGHTPLPSPQTARQSRPQSSLSSFPTH